MKTEGDSFLTVEVRVSECDGYEREKLHKEARAATLAVVWRHFLTSFFLSLIMNKITIIVEL